MSPRDLLNRLIVPLEQGVDYVNIARAGTSVAVPFTCLLMLSTNLRPQALMDEAFLRRVRYKVMVPDPTAEEFREIWRRQCMAREVEYREDVINDLMEKEYTAKDRGYHGSHPRDLLDHVIHLCRYIQRDPELNDELLEDACQTYFVEVDD